MKPGDIVIAKSKIVEAADQAGAPLYTVSAKNDTLTLIEGKADIEGCVLAKDIRGEIHCINPSLFEIVYTLEEAVANRLKEPEMQFEPVSFEEVHTKMMNAMGKAMAIDLDKTIMDSLLPTASGPSLSEEETVARKMMEPEKPLLSSSGDGKMTIIDEIIDKATMDSLLSTSSREGAENIARQVGLVSGNEE